MGQDLTCDYSHIGTHPFFSTSRDWFFKALEMTAKPERTYLELGVAYGASFGAACEAMELNSDIPWRAVGVDLLHGGWEYNPYGIGDRLKRWGVKFSAAPPDKLEPRQPVICTNGAADFLSKSQFEFDVVFIDACHSFHCASSDFRGVEPMVKPGGIVIFHDADPDSQGDDFEIQPHCRMGIGVRQAIIGLGLLDDSRPGWKFLAETSGCKTGPRGSVIVRKHE